ncbi:hypothetical protein EV360DRAFT_72419 [Lentinula raphanica]|nr:hypothetical protein EV360DRAFT_72419 [Lentinula raphanica]
MPKCSSAPRIGLLFLLFLIVNVVLAAPVSTDAPVGTDNWIRVLIIRSKTSHQGKSDPDRLVPKDEGIGSNVFSFTVRTRSSSQCSLPWASSYNGYDAIHIASVETTEEEANEVISKMTIAKLPTPPNQYESLTKLPKWFYSQDGDDSEFQSDSEPGLEPIYHVSFAGWSLIEKESGQATVDTC